MAPDDIEILVSSMTMFLSRLDVSSLAITVGQTTREHFVSFLINKSGPKSLEIFVFDSSSNPLDSFHRHNLRDAKTMAGLLSAPDRHFQAMFVSRFGSLDDDGSRKSAAQVSTLVRKRRDMNRNSKLFKSDIDSQIALLREMGQFVNILSDLERLDDIIPSAFYVKQYQTIVTTLKKFIPLLTERGNLKTAKNRKKRSVYQ